MKTKTEAGQKRKPKKKKPPFTDSPINIGGGGGIEPMVELWFDHNEYVPDPNDRDNFVNRALAFRNIEINGVSQNLGPNSTIVVEFKKGGSTKKITITASPPSVPLGVEFKGNDLRYNHQSKKHRDDGSVLKRVIINGAPTTLGEEDQIGVHTQ